MKLTMLVVFAFTLDNTGEDLPMRTGLISAARVVAVISLTACASQQISGPPLPRARPNVEAAVLKAHLGRGDLAYVAELQAGYTQFYKFPKMAKPLGTIATPPRGICSDRAGNVWISTISASNGGELIQYQHGGTEPIRQLPATMPGGCAVDTTTGNLAVLNASTASSPAFAAVYSQAKGVPTSYRDSNMSTMDFCTYDGLGNLFVEGESTGSKPTVVLAELVRNSKSKTLREIPISPTPYKEGGIQWDGAYLVVAEDVDLGGHFDLYRFIIAHAKATYVDTISVSSDGNGYQIVQFSIVGDSLGLVQRYPDEPEYSILDSYAYPQGGYRLHSKLIIGTAVGMTISPGT